MRNTLKISSYSSQRGIGLVEVMVALMLLAIAVLGFTAMQMTAVKATDESLMRTRALTVMRGGAEMMRANPLGIDAFKAAINGTTTVSGIDTNSCQGKGSKPTCSIEEMATRDALAVKDHATKNDMQVNMVTCPGTSGGQARQCFVASWGSTNPTLNGGNNDCATTTGSYKMGAQCFIMEAY